MDVLAMAALFMTSQRKADAMKEQAVQQEKIGEAYQKILISNISEEE